MQSRWLKNEKDCKIGPKRRRNNVDEGGRLIDCYIVMMLLIALSALWWPGECAALVCKSAPSSASLHDPTCLFGLPGFGWDLIILGLVAPCSQFSICCGSVIPFYVYWYLRRVQYMEDQFVRYHGQSTSSISLLLDHPLLTTLPIFPERACLFPSQLFDWFIPDCPIPQRLPSVQLIVATVYILDTKYSNWKNGRTKSVCSVYLLFPFRSLPSNWLKFSGRWLSRQQQKRRRKPSSHRPHWLSFGNFECKRSIVDI